MKPGQEIKFYTSYNPESLYNDEKWYYRASSEFLSRHTIKEEVDESQGCYFWTITATEDTTFQIETRVLFWRNYNNFTDFNSVKAIDIVMDQL